MARRKQREITRDRRKKNKLFKFFELFVSKISKLCIFNIMYLVCILPIVCAVVVFGITGFGFSPEIVTKTVFVNLVMRVLNIPPVISITLLVISIFFYGPVTCGFSYAMRNLTTERYAWFSEMFTKAKANFKQGLVIGLLDVLIFSSCALYLFMDLSAVSGMMHVAYSILRVAAILITIFYVFMRYYLYNLAITFELKIKAIFKNAYIFAVLGFFKNILVTVITIAAVFLFTSTPYLDVFLTATILFSFCGFVSNYITYPVIKKYMIDAQEKHDELEEAAE